MNFETKRLNLKAIGFDDREFIFRHFSDDNVQKYLYNGEPLKNMEEADEFVNCYVNSNSDYTSRWILILKSNKKRLVLADFTNLIKVICQLNLDMICKNHIGAKVMCKKPYSYTRLCKKSYGDKVGKSLYLC